MPGRLVPILIIFAILASGAVLTKVLMRSPEAPSAPPQAGAEIKKPGPPEGTTPPSPAPSAGDRGSAEPPAPRGQDLGSGTPAPAPAVQSERERRREPSRPATASTSAPAPSTAMPVQPSPGTRGALRPFDVVTPTPPPSGRADAKSLTTEDRKAMWDSLVDALDLLAEKR